MYFENKTASYFINKIVLFRGSGGIVTHNKQAIAQNRRQVSQARERPDHYRERRRKLGEVAK